MSLDKDIQITRFLLIRHGQTQWNLDHRVQGHLDVPLNSTGILQARQLGEKLFIKQQTNKVAALYSSDLERAAATAREIGNKLGKEIFFDASLRELHCGKAQGLTRDEQEQLYGQLRRSFDRAYPHETRWDHPEWPGGESKNQLLARVYPFLANIAKKHRGQSVIIVTHSTVIRTLIAHLGHDTVPTPNCCIARFSYEHACPEQPLAFVEVEIFEDY